MRTGVVSWLRATLLAFPTLVSGVVSNVRTARYSGGAAPALTGFRIPCSICRPSRSSLTGPILTEKLGALTRDGKRGVQPRLEIRALHLELGAGRRRLVAAALEVSVEHRDLAHK